MNIDGRYLLLMCFFYVVTIAVETPVLVAGLSRRHPLMNRVFAGVWLTACTYPFVWLIFPFLIDRRTNNTLYLAVAETFAPAAECLLFWLAFIRPKSRPAPVAIIEPDSSRPLAIPDPTARRDLIRDMAVIVIANLASFGIGMLMLELGWWPLV
jgi:hypothetical protein